MLLYSRTLFLLHSIYTSASPKLPILPSLTPLATTNLFSVLKHCQLLIIQKLTLSQPSFSFLLLASIWSFCKPHQHMHCVVATKRQGGKIQIIYVCYHVW